MKNGFVPFNETRLACIEKYKPDEVDKFTEAILELQDKLKSIRNKGKGKKKASRPSEEQIDKQYGILFKRLKQKERVVLGGVVYCQKSEGKSLFYGLEFKKVEPLLTKIVDEVFTENKEYSEEVAMTKCLLEKVQNAK